MGKQKQSNHVSKQYVGKLPPPSSANFDLNELQYFVQNGRLSNNNNQPANYFFVYCGKSTDGCEYYWQNAHTQYLEAKERFGNMQIFEFCNVVQTVTERRFLKRVHFMEGDLFDIGQSASHISTSVYIVQNTDVTVVTNQSLISAQQLTSDLLRGRPLRSVKYVYLDQNVGLFGEINPAILTENCTDVVVQVNDHIKKFDLTNHDETDELLQRVPWTQLQPNDDVKELYAKRTPKKVVQPLIALPVGSHNVFCVDISGSTQGQQYYWHQVKFAFKQARSNFDKLLVIEWDDVARRVTQEDLEYRILRRKGGYGGTRPECFSTLAFLPPGSNVIIVTDGAVKSIDECDKLIDGRYFESKALRCTASIQI